MRNSIRGSLLILLFCGNCFAADASIQKVEVSPLSGGVSFNTITFADRSITGWVTAPSVEMIGRKEVMIVNVSINSVYLTGVSGSTAIGTLKEGEGVTFKAASNLHIYISSNSVAIAEVWEIR